MDTSLNQQLNTDIRDCEIQPGSTVLLRVPNGDVRCLKADQDSILTLGKFGSFHANELIHKPYGLTYEIIDKKLAVMPTPTLQEVDDTDATNELINDDQFVQPLTLNEIEALKSSGAHASDIIKKQIEQHANYSLKTEYSKEKYKKRKVAKYSKFFTAIEPTLFNVCEYWFKKDQKRIRDLRIDTLSQMLNLANIRPGGRYIAVDDASGLVVSGILERIGGDGRLITICDVDSPPAYPVMACMNFRNDIVTSVLSSLNWATAREDHIPLIAPSDVPTDQFKSDRHRMRLNKRKVISDMLMNTREELFAGEFDGLIISSDYDPFSIVEMLSPYVAGSGSVVVHSPHVQILADLQSKMRTCPQFLGTNLTEAWLRRYQVLPGRTHPMMNMTGTGGYLLHAIKVYDDPSASSILAQRRPRAKKLPTDERNPVQMKTSDQDSAGVSHRTSEGIYHMRKNGGG